MTYDPGVHADAVRVGVDIGGTGTRFVALTAAGDVVAQRAVATPRERGSVVQVLRDGVLDVASTRPVESVGIGASGPVDAGGVIRNPDTLPAFTGIDIRAPLRASMGAPVAIDNDAVTAAVYEATMGAAAGFASTLMITLGTGVGVAMLIGTRPVRGGDGQHPESGHLTVTGPAHPCYCGRAACFEQVASRSALQRAASALLGEEDAGLAGIERVAAMADAGDADALALFREYGRRLAEGIADLTTVFRPASVVIGGSAARFARLFESAVRDRLARVDFFAPQPELLFSSAGDFGGAIGAALLPS